MKWWEYLLFELLCIFLALISTFLWMFNFFTEFLIYAVSPIVRSLDYQINNASLSPILAICFLYPLTLAPLHWLNYKILRWNIWTYILLFLLANLIIAFFVVWNYSFLPVCYYGCPPTQ